MPEAGHVQRLRPLIGGLVDTGLDVHVFTDSRFADSVRAVGARFVDLFAGHPLDGADGESLPVPCRYVSFAGRYAEPIRRELEALRPALVVYDAFAVIARVLARALDLPHVNVCAGHNMDPRQVGRLIANHPQVRISDRCRRAVEVLRDGWGLNDASPFSYLTGVSPYLNVCCEPPEFLTGSERRAFEPAAFFGSLPPAAEISKLDGNGELPLERNGDSPSAYVSFGTVVWRYWRKEAIDTLRAVATAVGEMHGARALISLGGATIDDDDRRSLERGNVTVEDRVSQWRALRGADCFVTHHGLNSTHEAVYNRVPMLSYPFFSDQPALARRCQELGLAVPLADEVRSTPTPEEVRAALDHVAARRNEMLERLAEAREWELRAISERGTVLERIAALAAG
jgi:MGT family glycosyltransferase